MIEAENACLAAAFMSQKSASLVVQELSESDFFEVKNRLIYRAIRTIVDRQEQPDTTTVIGELRDKGRLDEAGGVYAVAALDLDLPDLNRLPQYMDLVRRHAIRVRFRAAFKEADGLAADPDTSIEAVAQKVTRLLKEEVASLPGWHPSSMDEDIDEALTAATSGSSGAYSTSHPELDRMAAGGFRRGELILVAGRPGAGKTIFSQALARYAASQGMNVAVVNFEMTRREQMFRDLAAECRIPLSYLREGRLKQFDVAQIQARREWFRSLNYWRLDSTRVPATLAGALSIARQIRRGPGLDVLHLDTVNLMRTDGERRIEEIGAISRGLKELAVEANLCVVLACQLNRDSPKQSDKRPQLHDLRDSGTLEQDADMVLMLHRESMYNQDADPGAVEILVRKMRNGECGVVPARFIGQITKIEPERKG